MEFVGKTGSVQGGKWKKKHKKLPHSIQYGIQRIVIHSNYSPLSDHQKFEDFRSGCQLTRIKQHRVLFREQVLLL